MEKNDFFSLIYNNNKEIKTMKTTSSFYYNDCIINDRLKRLI